MQYFFQASLYRSAMLIERGSVHLEYGTTWNNSKRSASFSIKRVSFVILLAG
jgi:hypothetical protein